MNLGCEIWTVYLNFLTYIATYNISNGAKRIIFGNNCPPNLDLIQISLVLCVEPLSGVILQPVCVLPTYKYS